jgi:outer membrane protein assembly factor BamB
VKKTFPMKGHPTAIQADASSVWFTDDQGNSLARVDATTARVIWRTKVCKAAVAMVRAHGSLWIVCSLDNQVLRVDAATGRLLGKTGSRASQMTTAKPRIESGILTERPLDNIS